MSEFAFVDTHLHLVYRDRLSYPWIDDVPALNQNFSLEQYQTEARRCGISDCLHMEVDVAEADIEAESRNVEALSKTSGSLVTGRDQRLPARSRGFSAIPRSRAVDPIVKGFRRVLHVGAGRNQPEALFRDNLRLLPEPAPVRSLRAHRPTRQGDRARRCRARRSVRARPLRQPPSRCGRLAALA